MTALTIFTAPKGFTNPHIALIQRNAIRSWMQLGKEVEVIVVGEEPGLAEAARELGVCYLPEVKRNPQGTPLVSSIFDLARQASTSPVLAYVNADILVMSDFLQAARQVSRFSRQYLVVGQRWDLDLTEELEYPPGWEQVFRQRVEREGRLHPPGGSDYFIFPREAYTDMPAFAIGRAGWDNWMIYHARCQGWEVIDATRAAQIVHQTHDYSHLPGGQPHYRLPETGENVRLAGGKRTIFGLKDANRVLVDGRIQKPRMSASRFWREAEICPLVTVHSMPLAQLAYAFFHPQKAYAEFRDWLRQMR